MARRFHPVVVVLLAVAVNGILAAVTKSAGTPLPTAGSWAALVPPQVFRNGVNPIDVFEVTTGNGGPQAYPAHQRRSRRIRSLE